MAHHSTLTLFLVHLSEHGHAEQNLVSPPHLPEVGWKQGVLGKFLFVVFRWIKLHHDLDQSALANAEDKVCEHTKGFTSKHKTYCPLGRRPRAPQAINRCMCVCVCVCVCVFVCHRRHYGGLSRCRLVGTELCASWRRFLYIGLHVKPRLHAWHSRRQSRSHFAFSSRSDQWEIRLFFIFRNSFLYKTTVSFTMAIKRSPGGQAVYACGGQSTSKSTCEVPAWTLTAFGDRSASSMSK